MVMLLLLDEPGADRPASPTTSPDLRPHRHRPGVDVAGFRARCGVARSRCAPRAEGRSAERGWPSWAQGLDDRLGDAAAVADRVAASILGSFINEYEPAA